MSDGTYTLSEKDELLLRKQILEKFNAYFHGTKEIFMELEKQGRVYATDFARLAGRLLCCNPNDLLDFCQKWINETNEIAKFNEIKLNPNYYSPLYESKKQIELMKNDSLNYNSFAILMEKNCLTEKIVKLAYEQKEDNNNFHDNSFDSKYLTVIPDNGEIDPVYHVKTTLLTLMNNSAMNIDDLYRFCAGGSKDALYLDKIRSLMQKYGSQRYGLITSFNENDWNLVVKAIKTDKSVSCVSKDEFRRFLITHPKESLIPIEKKSKQEAPQQTTPSSVQENTALSNAVSQKKKLVDNPNLLSVFALVCEKLLASGSIGEIYNKFLTYVNNILRPQDNIDNQPLERAMELTKRSSSVTNRIIYDKGEKTLRSLTPKEGKKHYSSSMYLPIKYIDKCIKYYYGIRICKRDVLGIAQMLKNAYIKLCDKEILVRKNELKYQKEMKVTSYRQSELINQISKLKKRIFNTNSLFESGLIHRQIFEQFSDAVNAYPQLNSIRTGSIDFAKHEAILTDSCFSNNTEHDSYINKSKNISNNVPVLDETKKFKFGSNKDIKLDCAEIKDSEKKNNERKDVISIMKRPKYYEDEKNKHPSYEERRSINALNNEIYERMRKNFYMSGTMENISLDAFTETLKKTRPNSSIQVNNGEIRIVPINDEKRLDKQELYKKKENENKIINLTKRRILSNSEKTQLISEMPQFSTTQTDEIVRKIYEVSTRSSSATPRYNDGFRLTSLHDLVSTTSKIPMMKKNIHRAASTGSLRSQSSFSTLNDVMSTDLISLISTNDSIEINDLTNKKDSKEIENLEQSDEDSIIHKNPIISSKDLEDIKLFKTKLSLLLTQRNLTLEELLSDVYKWAPFGSNETFDEIETKKITVRAFLFFLRTRIGISVEPKLLLKMFKKSSFLDAMTIKELCKLCLL